MNKRDIIAKILAEIVLFGTFMATYNVVKTWCLWGSGGRLIRVVVTVIGGITAYVISDIAVDTIKDKVLYYVEDFLKTVEECWNNLNLLITTFRKKGAES